MTRRKKEEMSWVEREDERMMVCGCALQEFFLPLLHNCLLASLTLFAQEILSIHPFLLGLKSDGDFKNVKVERMSTDTSLFFIT